jgi:alpha-tubulin suppressor-like RCC1 family protein
MVKAIVTSFGWCLSVVAAAGALAACDARRGSDGPAGEPIAAVAQAISVPLAATSVVAGGAHVCTILQGGRVKCWGNNDHGQLGLGDTQARDTAAQLGNALPFVDLGAGRTAVMLALGGAHTCAVLDNGQLKCWGSNGSGQLGLNAFNAADPLADNRGDAPGEMGNALPAVTLGAGRTARYVAAGSDNTCAILDNNDLKCWGSNTFGKLGLGDTDARGVAAGQMAALPRVDLAARVPVALALAGGSTCALFNNAQVACWGDNEAGNLGLGINPFTLPDNPPHLRPHNTDVGDQPGEMGAALMTINFGTGRTATAIDAGTFHTCALRDNGTVVCWGPNNGNSLGTNNPSPSPIGDDPGEVGDGFQPVPLSLPATAVAVGGNTSCARLNDAEVACWGSNSGGQLGDVPNNDVVIVVFGTPALAAAVTEGDNHTCVLTPDSRVKCWGGGFGTLAPDLPPVDLGSIACTDATPRERIFGFESAADWTSAAAAVTSVSSPITAGCAAVGVTGQGYIPVASAAFTTAGLTVTPAISVDLFIPGNQPNPFWMGSMQMLLTCPSGNAFNQYIGQVELTGRPQQAFSTLRYPLPAPVAATLRRTLNDCSFTIALNVNATGRAHILDNLRFTP